MADKGTVQPIVKSNGNWQSFRHWAISFVVCNFDVDVGPEIELVFPPQVDYSASDLSAICFHSFPERQDTEPAEDAFFHFIIRNGSPDIQLSSPSVPYGSPSFFYGTSCFRQEHDSMTKRSFNQKALVILSMHEFPALFSRLLATITKSGFISDPARLEAACSEINKWPAPRVGKQELPFFGDVITLEIAPHWTFPLQGLYPPSGGDKASSASVFAYEPVGDWHTLLQQFSSLSLLYQAFEKLFLAESVVILAKNPQQCSAVASGLIDLIKPVPYGGPYRPYLTMQSEFLAGPKDAVMPKNFLLGITNPFLLKRIITAAEANGQATPLIVHLKEPVQPPPLKLHRSLRGHRKQEIDIPGGLDAQPHSRKHLKSDHDFLNRLDQLLRDNATTSTMVNHLVRRHFSDLTAQLLSPLNRYLTTHLAASATSADGGVQYANFNSAEFMKSLAKHGSSVKWRGQNPIQHHRARDQFYQLFCDSPNFYAWLEMKCTLEQEAVCWRDP